jgi:rhodanese-related sulfurtransferase
MVVKYKLGSILTILSLLFVGVFSTKGWSTGAGGYKNISVDQFNEMMDHKDFILINVHVPYRGEIAETDLLLPFHAIDQQKEKLPDDMNTKIVVYCMSGPMGYVAAEKLVSMGYRQVIHFQGGMVSWKNSGKKLVNRPN